MVNVNLGHSVSYPKSHIQKKNNEQQVSFKGNVVLNEIAKAPAVKDIKDFPWDKWMGLVTALVTVTGFGLGGAGLMYDHFKKDKVGKTDSKTNEKLQTKSDNKDNNPVNNITMNNTAPTTKNPLLAKYQQKPMLSFTGDKKEKEHVGEGEAGHIDPKTPFGKFGLKAAKTGILFSGIAGIFNGVAMGLPLMAAGEAVNVAASPIINKPAGYGLFSLALAAVFAGRALENDPSLKLDLVKTAQKNGILGFHKTLGAAGKNMFACLNEVKNSTIKVGTNLFKLVNFTKPEGMKNAALFFKDTMFSLKPKTISMEQMVTAAGNSISKSSMKSHPYFMHTASLMLGIGGVFLATSAILKEMGVLKGDLGKNAVKNGFKTCEVGGSLDNLSLSLAGAVKLASGKDLASGLAQTASGITMIAGQPNAEKDYGRALIWTGCAALFTAFVFERKHDLQKAYKAFINKGQMTDEATKLLRQFDIDLTKLAPRKIINKYYSQIQDLVGVGKNNDAAKAAAELLKVKDSGLDNIVKVFEAMKNITGTGKFKKLGEKEATEYLKQNLRDQLSKDKQLPKEALEELITKASDAVKWVSEGNLEEAIKAVKLENLEKLGKEIIQ